MSGDLILCGWRVRSALPLSGLLAWQGDDRLPDVEISLGAIPAPVEQPVLSLPHSRLWANGTFLLALDNVGRFLVTGGNRVWVEPADNAQPSELKAFLLGSVLGMLCHQRGLLPIHASAVRIDGGAVLIAGNSGAGKSTLAAALGARGHALVADDIAAFDPKSGMILPAFPQRKLSTDVLQELALDHAGLVANRPGQPKFHVTAIDGFDPAPLPPLVIYVLERTKPEPSGKAVRTMLVTAIAELDRLIYRRATGVKIQPAQAMFKALTQLAQAAPVYHLYKEAHHTLNGLDRLAEQAESHARGLMQK